MALQENEQAKTADVFVRISSCFANCCFRVVLFDVCIFKSFADWLFIADRTHATRSIVLGISLALKRDEHALVSVISLFKITLAMGCFL
jgi:hypothetical protein